MPCGCGVTATDQAPGVAPSFSVSCEATPGRGVWHFPQFDAVSGFFAVQAGHSMGVRAYLLGGPHYDACRLESKQLRHLAVLNLVSCPPACPVGWPCPARTLKQSHAASPLFFGPIPSSFP